MGFKATITSISISSPISQRSVSFFQGIFDFVHPAKLKVLVVGLHITLLCREFSISTNDLWRHEELWTPKFTFRGDQGQLSNLMKTTKKDERANVVKHKITQTVPIQMTHMPSCSRGRWHKSSYKIRQTQVKGQGNLLQRCQRGKKVNGTLNNVNNCNHTPKQMSTVQNVGNPTYSNKKTQRQNYILKEWRLSVEMVKKQNKYWMKAYGSLLMLS